ncbi:hypothetical protein H2203_000435 [Taxawa tesnikishii (nom. ined.)]|nr:hypothetical protein H2203_000435 [Dothideales sp. JES 119]
MPTDSHLCRDTRKPSAPFRQYTESHNDTITQLSFHPSKSNILLSAATDGLVSLFDTTIADEDDALTQVLNHYSAVHCAGFVDEEEVYAVSSDEQLSVYTLSKPDDAEDAVLPVTTFGDVHGHIRLWAPEEQTHQPMTEAMEVDSPDKTKKKKKRKGKKEERFKPY